MARITSSNVQVQVAVRGMDAFTAPFVGERGITLAFDGKTRTPRQGVVPEGAATMLDTLISVGCKFVVKGHGVRVIQGGASPFFLEANGMTDPAGVTLYVYGGNATPDKPAKILGLLDQAGVRVASHRAESKGGLYVTLPPDVTGEECGAALGCLAPLGSIGLGDGAKDLPGWGAACALPESITPPEPKPAKADKPAKAKGERKAKAKDAAKADAPAA